MYKQVYYEAIDLAVNNITERFDEPGFRVYSKLEQLLCKACTHDNYQEELNAVCTIYSGEMEQNELSAQPSIFYQQKQKTKHRRRPVCQTF